MISDMIDPSAVGWWNRKEKPHQAKKTAVMVQNRENGSKKVFVAMKWHFW